MNNKKKRKWLNEKILHLYWIENCKKYKLPNGTQIKKAYLNPIFDRYPDITENVLDDESVVPCEIEWRTTDFDHDIDVLKSNDGFLVTFIENKSFSVPQIQIKEEDFKQWFCDNAARIVTETVDKVKLETKARDEIIIWVIYTGKRGKRDFDIALKNGIWAFPQSQDGNRRGKANIVRIKEGDYVVIINNFEFASEKKSRTPRIKETSRFIGTFNNIVLARVTSDYYYDCPSSYPWHTSKYVHRFKFDNENAIIGENVPCNQKVLGKYLHEHLVSQMHKLSIGTINSTEYMQLQNICLDNKRK